jgi:hypothetical protein
MELGHLLTRSGLMYPEFSHYLPTLVIIYLLAYEDGTDGVFRNVGI